jgi:redox-regulated HSP33 family molecular chaperone
MWHRTENKAHKKMVEAAKGSRPITAFMPQQNPTNFDQKVMRAEAMYTDLIVEMNLPLSVADKFTKIHKVVFPDSEIAKGYKCSRDKTTALVKCVGQEEANDVVAEMKSGPFFIATDGSVVELRSTFCIVRILFYMYPARGGKR